MTPDRTELERMYQSADLCEIGYMMANPPMDAGAHTAALVGCVCTG